MMRRMKKMTKKKVSAMMKCRSVKTLSKRTRGPVVTVRMTVKIAVYEQLIDQVLYSINN
jgi:hypothetical protein